MFKRVRWVGIGAVLGAGGSLYAQLKMRRTAQRYLPPEVGARVLGQVRSWGREVHDAVAEGRQAMTEREAELRALVDPGLVPPGRDVRDAGSRPIARHREPPGLPQSGRRGGRNGGGRRTRRDPRSQRR